MGTAGSLVGLVLSRHVMRVALALLLGSSCGATRAQSSPSSQPIRLGVTGAIGSELGGSVAAAIDRGNARQPSVTVQRVDNPGDLLSDLKAGKVQVALVPTSALPAVAPGFRVFDSFFQFSDLDDVERFQRSADGRELLTQLTRSGLIGLSYVHDGLLQVATRAEINRVRDLEGISLAVRATRDSFTASQFAALGTFVRPTTGDPTDDIRSDSADAVEVSWREVRQQLGVVVGTGRKVVPTNHRYRGYLVVANEEFFKGLNREEARSLSARVAQITVVQNDNSKRLERSSNLMSVTAPPSVPLSVTAASNADVRATLAPIWFPSSVPNAQRYVQIASAERAAGPNMLSALYSRAQTVATAAQAKLAPPTEFAWNTWVDPGNGTSVEHLVGGEVYEVRLDLSRYRYTDAADAAPGLSTGIAAAIQKRKPFRLTIRAVLLTDGARFADGAARERAITVQPEVLARATKPDDQAKELAEIKSVLQQSGDLAALSARYALASAAFPLVAQKRATCLQIAFLVSDGGGIEPLDHVVLSIPVQSDEQGTLGTCEMSRVQGGFSTLLSGFQNSKAVDASLHIFHWNSSSGLRGLAMFADAKKYNAAPNAAALEERGIFWWEVADLERYVSEDLPGIVRTARKNRNYASVASELRGTVFPFSAASEEQDGARGAYLALRELAHGRPSPPTVLVRTITAKGRHLYAPLGLLGASPELGRLNVVYPLPRRSPTDEVCVAAWHVGYPENLEGVDTKDLALKDDTDYDPRYMQRLKKFSDLKDYLNPPTAKDLESPLVSTKGGGEALLLLAHQANGYLWFDKGGYDDASLRVGAIANNRKFSPGSVAFLSACSVADPQRGNQDWIEKFSSNGVESFVVSPFPIDLEYGRHLALSAMRKIRAAYQDGVKDRTTIRELFATAAKEAAPSADLDQDTSLEFIILGDPETALCLPAPK